MTIFSGALLANDSNFNIAPSEPLMLEGNYEEILTQLESQRWKNNEDGISTIIAHLPDEFLDI